MTQNILLKPAANKPFLSLNMPEVSELFPGFAAGDFAVLYGSPSVTYLTSLLCVRAQLPVQLGGLGSNVVFIDGGNTFLLYQITKLAQLHHLDPKKTLDRIFISRAFTAYQLTSLLMDKLQEAVRKYDAKLVIISDIAQLFLDANIPDDEAQNVYSQITRYLENFAKEKQIIWIATCPNHTDSERNALLREITCQKANITLYFQKTPYTSEVSLEKHPSFVLGTAELPSENLQLTDFM
jgi:hypothetical protein